MGEKSPNLVTLLGRVGVTGSLAYEGFRESVQYNSAFAGASPYFCCAAFL
jgi:hypothetical protein